VEKTADNNGICNGVTVPNINSQSGDGAIMDLAAATRRSRHV
jgi:hypothetical protein